MSTAISQLIATTTDYRKPWTQPQLSRLWGGGTLFNYLENMTQLNSTVASSSTCLALPSLTYGIPSGQFSLGSWSVLRESSFSKSLTWISRELFNL